MFDFERKETKTSSQESSSHSQFLSLLRSKDNQVQLKAAKDFYACLINELKQVKPENETNFVDSLIPHIKELASENNPNISDKLACIYIITSIINLDNINVKVRKKHQTSFFRWLRNLLACADPIAVHMVSRAMGKYALAGVECDVEFKSALENLNFEQKRFQGILLVRELALATPSRLFLSAAHFYQNIMSAICDRSPEIRYEAVKLFRLSLIICISRENLNQTSSTSTTAPSSVSGVINQHASSAANASQRVRRASNASSSHETFHHSEKYASPGINHMKYQECFDKSLAELRKLVNDGPVKGNQNIFYDL